MTITEFLEARIAEDERRAKYYGPYAMGTRRVLAECAAKRAIIGEHVEVGSSLVGGREVERWRYCEACQHTDDDGAIADGVDYPCQTVRALAAVYADHEDYDSGWAL